jgi:hypothetical protein
MECENYKGQLSLLLTGAVDSSRRLEIENHLVGCPDCRMELEATQKVWDLLGEIPNAAPSGTMRGAFYSMLNDFKEQKEVGKKPVHFWVKKLMRLWQSQPTMRLAYSVIFLMLGLGAGYLVWRPSQPGLSYNRQIDSLSSQVSEMKQMMMLSLLENPSASERIRAVGFTNQMGSSNKKVIGALLTTLNEDPNVNVRLMTLEALSTLASEPSVREGLVQSITLQDSPLMQSAIADVMVKLQEKRSVKPLQNLLHKKDINAMVKIKIQQSIQKII